MCIYFHNFQLIISSSSYSAPFESVNFLYALFMYSFLFRLISSNSPTESTILHIS